VELLTDHTPLECIYSPKSNVCARIERWVLRMQSYKFKVRYIPGTKNIADALSRLIKENVTESTAKRSATEDYVKFVATELTPVAMTTREMERAAEGDQALRPVRKCLS
jgi:hypothetical protein